MWGKRRMFDIHFWERFVASANHAYLACLFITLVATVAVVYGAGRLGKMKEADANARIEVTKRDAAQANQRSAEADERAAEANERAAQANEHAAEAKQGAALSMERAKLLEKQVVEYKAKYESAIAESRDAEARLAHQQQKTAETQLVLEKTLEGIRDRHTPRTLTAEQRSRLLVLLSHAAKGELKVQVPVGDDEATAYTQELCAILTAAGWPVDSKQMGYIAFIGRVPKGVGVYVKDAPKDLRTVEDFAQAAPRFAADLAHALAGIGISVEVGQNVKQESEVVLRIGAKP